MGREEKFLGGLAAILVTVSALILSSFIGYVIGAIILAFVMKPVQKRLAARTRPDIATLLTIIIIIFSIATPFVLAVNAVADDGRSIVDSINSQNYTDFSEVESLIYNRTGHRINIDSKVSNSVENFTDATVSGIPELLKLIADLVIGSLVLLFILFYMLRDGETLYSWLMSVTPLSAETEKELTSKLHIMGHTVLKGHVLVAVLQAIVGGIGLWIAGIPGAAFWTFIMALLSILPVIGAFLVWFPATIYLSSIGEAAPAVFLFLYGAIIISLVDEGIRPYMVDENTLHPSVVLVGALGGIYVFGAVGLFIGPVILGFTKTVLDVLMLEKQNYEHI
ncbi:MAG: hypothetical protein BRC26_01250 [Nanohaloarchaea archaeon QH_8_44_6]|nr:MAG: hypothetical protein BRC26_01250 [Nanohaloarchaea archaeon QH_8_44_6]